MPIANIRMIFRDAKPDRGSLCRDISISRSFACEIAKGSVVKSTEALARIASHLRRRFSRRRAAEILLASLEEWYPAAFTGHDEASDSEAA